MANIIVGHYLKDDCDKNKINYWIKQFTNRIKWQYCLTGIFIFKS